MTYGQQGWEEKGEAILRQLFTDHPDYLFARTMLARLSIARGELEEAKNLLTRCLERVSILLSLAPTAR